MRISVGRFVVVLGSLALAGAAIGCKTNIDQSDNKNVGGGDAGSTQADAGSSKGFDELDESISAITGVLLEEGSLVPIQGATVTADFGASVLTNSKGQWVMDAGVYTQLNAVSSVRVCFSHPDYVSGDCTNALVGKGSTTQVQWTMKKAAQQFNIDISPNLVTVGDNDFDGDIAYADVQIQLKNAAASDEATFSINVPTKDGKWLQADPKSGTITGTPVIVTLTIDKSKLDKGVYNSNVPVFVNDATGSEQIQVKVQISEPGSAFSGGAGGTDGTDAGGTDGGADASGGTDGTDGTN